MRCGRSRSHPFRRVVARARSGLGLAVLLSGAVTLVLAGVVPTEASAQQHAPGATALAFDGVTVVDVEHGKLLPDQRVVIVGNRIQSVGNAKAITLPKGTQAVDARGKYLIPGLWDMHTHADRMAYLLYPIFLASGVTGIRDAGSSVPLDTLRLWRQEILAGTRVGPPRQLLSGQSISDMTWASMYWPRLEGKGCQRGELRNDSQTCVNDAADARQYVDSLKAAGADMIKPRMLDEATYFAVAAEARRVGIRFGGHTAAVSASAASDSGASILDHVDASDLQKDCISLAERGALLYGQTASVERCRPVAERLRRNGTWWVPTLLISWIVGPASEPVYARFSKSVGALPPDSGLRPDPSSARRQGSGVDSIGILSVAQQVGMPMLAGTDVSEWDKASFALHAELEAYVAEGLTPLSALQSATLNPAKMLHGTDSLGTVAPGKLADLVLLDANPLEDIANATRIRAVIANGRYFDRPALDSLLAEVRAKVKEKQP